MKKLLLPLLLLAIGAAAVACSEHYAPGEGDYNNGTYPTPPPAPSGNQFADYGENPFIEAATQSKSSFSVDADGASYATIRALINNGQDVPKEAVRIEEMLNYFNFDYPDAVEPHKLSFSHELAYCPWDGEHLLLRLGLKGQEIAVENWAPANYVFLIDVSGSMNSATKLGLLKRGLLLLTEQLRPEDRVSIVTYSGRVDVLLEGEAGDNYDAISKAIEQLKAGGVTNGGDALNTAYRIAKSCYIEGGNNRIIVGTDGDFNMGVTSQESLVEIVKRELENGIYLSVLGFGLGNLNDSMMEQLAANGNGVYDYIDSEEQMIKVFAQERNRMQAVTKDAKVQVEFNPEYVLSYRLIGYENRVMSNEDFENDETDAGEIGTGQTITALYEVVPLVGTSPDMKIASCTVNYKDLDENNLTFQHDIDGSADFATPELKWAASLAAWGMIMRESPYAGTADIALVKSLAEAGAASASVAKVDPYGWRKAHLELLDKWIAAEK